MSHSPFALRTEIAALLPRLRRFALVVAGRQDDADELVQTGVERALQHLDAWQDGARLDGWLLRLMTHAWVDDAPSPEEADARADAGVDLAPSSIAGAMASLPEEQRVAVGLVLVEGLPGQDAAAVIEATMDVLASRLAQGRAALHQRFGDVARSAPPSNDADRQALAAYLDGAMPEAELIAFEARAARDDALFDAIGHERALRSALKTHFDAVLDEPVPAVLLDLLVMPPEIAAEDDAHDDPVPSRFASSRFASSRFASSSFASSGFVSSGFAPSRPAPSRFAESRLELVPPASAPTPVAAPIPAGMPASAGEIRGMASWQAWGGMVACLALGVLLGARTVPALPATTASGAFALDDGGAIVASGALRDALEQRSGGSPGARASGVAIGLSFRDKAQDDCRTFAVDTAKGIACKSNGQWAVAALEQASTPADPPTSDATPPTPASALSPTLLLTIDALRDGETFDAAAEAAAHARHWQR